MTCICIYCSCDSRFTSRILCCRSTWRQCCCCSGDRCRGNRGRCLTRHWLLSYQIFCMVAVQECTMYCDRIMVHLSVNEKPFQKPAGVYWWLSKRRLILKAFDKLISRQLWANRQFALCTVSKGFDHKLCTGGFLENVSYFSGTFSSWTRDMSFQNVYSSW